MTNGHLFQFSREGSLTGAWADTCVPSGLGVWGLPFLGLKPQALCLRPSGADFSGAEVLSGERL